MSAPKNANPLKPIKVSARDRAIYQAVVIDQKQQRVVALEYKLSQPRVSAIIARVTRWLSQGDPPGLNELYRRDRLRAVSRVHRLRLEQLYKATYAAWENSGATERTIKKRTVKGEVVLEESSVKTRPLDSRYVRELKEIAERIVAFEGFDKLGNVDESCEGRLYEEPERTPVDGLREVKRRVMAGVCDTPGDEGIPGMWSKEMEQRNAVVKKKQKGEAIREGEAPAEPNAPRQQAAHSLAPILRGEGPEQREDVDTKRSSEKQISDEYLPQEANITPNNFQQSENKSVINPDEVLSKESTDSAQVEPQPVVTSAAPAPKVLSNSPPKVPRFRLMGTVGEMVESLGYDDYFDPVQRMMRAYEEGAFSPAENSTRCRPLSPTLSPEYRGEGVRQSASHSGTRR